ncbi:MAG: trimeric intracellular cation channel family protein [Thermoplasmataceae archaeon]
MDYLLLILNLMGTFVFGISGAIAGVRHKTDIFGVIVLSYVAANAGGILRDLIIGAIPPATITQWWYIVAAFVPGPLVFYFYPVVQRLDHPVLVFDAAGLSLFAVSGSLKALQYHINPLASILLGIVTAVGGGASRDVLVGEIPAVLRTDIYAVAALAGSSILVITYLANVPSYIGAIAGASLCFVIRILSIHFKWRLPAAKYPE